MIRVPLDSTRYFEPVTVRAAPRNVIEIIFAFSFYLYLSRFVSEEPHLSAGMPEERRARAELAARAPSR